MGKTTREYLKNKQDIIGDDVDNDWFTTSTTYLNYMYKVTGYQAEKLEKWDFTKEQLSFKPEIKNMEKFETVPIYARTDVRSI